MINVKKVKLSNGLTLLHHYNGATRMVAVNLLYKVGSKNENPNHTGLAHLIEHMMFTGSANAPSFDGPLQAAGGENNAWTNVDMTDFYETLPAQNIETALWLERDRLLNLNLDNHSIDLQKSVVIEEFKQRYLNQPYGDMLHLMHGAAYEIHPYRWPTIGLSIDDIENVSNETVRDFFNRHYAVNNLIMCIAGNIEWQKAIDLVDKWFGDIEPHKLSHEPIPVEPEQTAPRIIEKESSRVPATVITRGYHMCDRLSPDFAATDLLSDILANGQSSRFKRGLLQESKLFSDLDASVEGVCDPGLFYIRARLTDGTDINEANAAIDNELALLLDKGVTEREVTKYANKFVATQLFDNVGYDTKATRLSVFECRSKAEDINLEDETYSSVSVDDINRVAHDVLRPENCTTVFYKKC